MILILATAVSMKSTQPVLADSSCDTSVYYTFPSDPSKPWYTISASKTDPDKPVVKQQLEELAARGDLSKNIEEYYAKFTATVSLAPGTATWNYAHSTWEWKPFFSYCTEKNVCPGVWKEVKHCDPESATVYRSIQTMKVFLIPSIDTLDWYWNWEQSPTVMYAYPDFWILVSIGEGGTVTWVPPDSSGLHFYSPIPLRDASFYLPSKLTQKPISEEVINPADAGILKTDIDKVIPVCDIIDGNSTTPPTYGYEDRYHLITDIDDDPYYCNPATTVADNKVQSVKLDITDYDFDIPGTFYIGVVTQISPAVLPDSPFVTSENKPRTEPVTYPTDFQPSNINDGSYVNTEFTVWMIISTPCWSGDGGCNTEKNP
jgi:hypothetical protein